MEFFNRYKNDMLTYVKTELDAYETSGNPRKLKIAYSRFEHTLRVYKWMEKLYAEYPDKEKLDFESLAIATIFHDIGYCDVEHHKQHATIGAGYCREYLEKKGYPADRTDFVCDLIARHSGKGYIHEDIPAELVLLMEADLLDDIGAQGLVMDVWLEAACEENVTFESILAHMERFTIRQMQAEPMHTEAGKRFWAEKQKLAEDFVNAYREDLRKGFDTENVGGQNNG